MANRRLLLALFLWGTCSAAWAQLPAGAEFQVNAYTPFGQLSPAVASDANGNFVVVWNGPRGSSLYEIFGQRFNAYGVPQGSEFWVNSSATGWQESPAVVADALGNFVVVWQSYMQYGYGVFGRRFDSSGLPQGGEFRVSSDTGYYQLHPAVSAGANGDFVVVWTSTNPGGTNVLGHRFDAAGVPQGSEFRVNTDTPAGHSGPAVASAALGNFVVVWNSYPGPDGSGSAIVGQRFDSSGVRQGSEFLVNTYTAGNQFGPAVASDPTGNFVVVWVSSGQDGSDLGVFGQRFSASGLAEGTEFKVNSYTPAAQTYPAVAFTANGNFVVVWDSLFQDGSSYGVFGQRFDVSGVPQGRGFRINSFTTGSQSRPAVAATASGDFVVAWHGQGAADTLGIFGKRYGDLLFRDGFE